ncbi:uncharacterized protein LOC135585771 isoform X1 [Musa acuminata AAA Group]|uniref:uncharacterized protein LOC135585771 isoform X1 n=1 Tax=Musa acuminata AAA Group TaxID=214697 RepID=UPI0031E2FF7E
MGNSKPPVATKGRKKKKGRPSLLDLQRRSLRLQRLEQQEEDPQRNPSPPDDDPRRQARPKSNTAAEDDDDEDDRSGSRRREKKLRLVLRLPNNPSADSAPSGSESDGRRAEKVGSVGIDAQCFSPSLQTERQNPASKATDLPQDSGPTTPLPDKKLLVFILDRLQKKDTYGVFAEPVDPEELPDYHDIIEHPMDFATIRKKLSSGSYANLEQFEKDVFLISSNAMQYNAPDTIYYRQARSIQELAKKNFENLRQESDDNEPEPKPVRRGRPPYKNVLKKAGRPPADHAGSNFPSNATLANAGDNSHWNFSHDFQRKGIDKASSSELPTKPYGLHSIEANNLTGEHKYEKNEENSGSAVKGVLMKNPRKSLVINENRRITYSHPQVFGSTSESSLLTTFDGERRQLVPVGLYVEHAYARSLARFAAKLGPIGWEIAAKRIEAVLSPGTKFGRGWVGDNETPQQSQPPLLTISPSHISQPENISTTTAVSASEHPPNSMFVEVRANTNPPAASSALPSRSVGLTEGAARNHDSAFKPENAVGGHLNWQKTTFQLEQAAATQPTMNGFNTPLGLNRLSQVGKVVATFASTESTSSESVRTHSRAPDMVLRNSSQTTTSPFRMDKLNSNADPSASSSSGNHLPDSGHDPHGTWRRGLSPNPKLSSVPPDLNVGFRSPGSPVSGVLLDSQNPNLSLQL